MGKILDSEGELWRQDVEIGYAQNFETLDAALKEKDRLLSKVSWGQVQIFDVTAEEKSIYVNKNVSEKYLAEQLLLNRYLALPWYRKIFTAKPVLKYLKHN